MSELTLNEKRKIIRREFKQFNQENGFRFVRPNTLLRERNDILQYLQFKIKAGYISCEIASQPYTFRLRSSASTYPPEFSS